MLKVSSECLSINQMEFEAPIGVYDFEKTKKGKFRVSVDIWGNFENARSTDQLEDTLDYQLVYTISQRNILNGGNLIEHIAQKIGEELCQIHFPMTKIRVYIEKLHPPIEGIVASTSFEWIAEAS